MADRFNMSGDVRGAILNIKSTLTNVQQSVGEIPGGDETTRKELENLIGQLSEALQKVPAEKQEEAQAIAETAKTLVDTARAEKPNKTLLQMPMVLKDVAEDISMHESTISRVTTNKYMHTPRGIFELKYFFNSSISKTSGDAIASKSVQEEIRKIISGEDARKPLSDSEIVDILSRQGISIARRTVAKYREMMGILPSSKRKKYIRKAKN